MSKTRKTKKRNKPARQRSVAYVAQTAGLVDSITITYNSLTGELQFEEADSASLRMEVFYERDSGKEKTLLSMPIDLADVDFNGDRSLVRDYDYLVAVDTNTRTLAGVRFSIVCAYMTPSLGPCNGQIPFSGLACYAVFGVMDGINPERIGWHLILQRHILPKQQEAMQRVGLIVDSELGALPKINDRAAPYYDQHMLPQGVRFIYASDAAAETLPSEMIRYCDTAAERSFKKVEKVIAHRKIPVSRNGDSNFFGFATIGILHEDADSPSA